ncbi:MAG TPA: MATE family efflux transporter [Bacillota bacterium]|nr:MATE family efflux transporter [Bacillota bacterium]
METTAFEHNLSKGNVTAQLFRFALPFLISNLIQSLYSVADMVIVGQFAGTEAMSGVNIGSQATFIITNIVFGLCVGGTVLIGQYMGAGNRNAIREVIGTLFSGLLILAAVITASMLILTDPLLRLIQTPPESYAFAKSYFIVTVSGIVFIFGYNALSAVMRGLGDSKNPLYFVTIACFTNIVLDLLLVAVIPLGAMGAAIATVVSQALSMILCIIYLRKKGFIFDFSRSSFKLHKHRVRQIITVGLPSAIQNGTVGISFMFLTAFANSIGYAASAALGAVGKYNGFAILPAVAISSSVSAMVSHNIGAGEYERAKKTMLTGMLFAMAITYPIFILTQLFPAQIIKIFNDDPALLAYGVEYLRVFSFDYLLVPFVFCFNGLYTGAGHTRFSLFNSLISSVLARVPAAYVFGFVFGWGLRGIGVGAPFATLVALIVGVIFFISGKWKKQVVVLSPHGEE